jgi:predicted lipoprotein with Yx(FWY)xxD motif
MKASLLARALAAGLLITGTLAACGDDADTATGSTPTSAAATAEPSLSDSAATAPAATSSTVMTAESDLGTILVDGEGMTLYLFTKDTQGSGESTCEGPCLEAWPPLVGEPAAGAGADAAKLGSIVRTDGTTQATYNGWPLYYWVEDTAPGDTKGQAVNDVWWVLDPAGDAIGAP